MHPVFISLLNITYKQPSSMQVLLHCILGQNSYKIRTNMFLCSEATIIFQINEKCKIKRFAQSYKLLYLYICLSVLESHIHILYAMDEPLHRCTYEGQFWRRNSQKNGLKLTQNVTVLTSSLKRCEILWYRQTENILPFSYNQMLFLSQCVFNYHTFILSNKKCTQIILTITKFQLFYSTIFARMFVYVILSLACLWVKKFCHT